MKRNEEMDAAANLLLECMADLHAAEAKARQALAWIAGEADAAPAPLLKGVAELAIAVAHQREVALNVHHRTKHHADFAAIETPEEMDALEATRREEGGL